MENLAPSRLLKTRQGTIVIGVAAAVLAAILLLVYLSHYRSSVNGATEPQTVLVAKRLIPKGTPGAAFAQKNLFDVTTIPKDQLKFGAISDPAVLRGTVAAADIYPRQQLTTADFIAASAGALASHLKGDGHTVLLCAADTFRAAATEQLEVWGERTDTRVVSQKTGADPSATSVPTATPFARTPVKNAGW